jgi:hypothetical protein
VTPELMLPVTRPLLPKDWVWAFELTVAPSVFVAMTVVVSAAQLIEFVPLGVALPVTSQLASADSGPASSIASTAADSADEPSSAAGAAARL